MSSDQPRRLLTMRNPGNRSDSRSIVWSSLWLYAIFAVTSVNRWVKAPRLHKAKEDSTPRDRGFVTINRLFIYSSLCFAESLEYISNQVKRRLLVDNHETNTTRHAYDIWLCFGVLTLLTIATGIGRSMNEGLIVKSPELLLWLSPSFDHSIRAVTRMSLEMFLVIGVVRRLIADPFWWWLGRNDTEGLQKSRWRPIQALGVVIADVENRIDRHERSERNILIWHFFTADMFNSYLLGHLGVSWKKILPINVAGTLLTVYGMYLAGEALRPYVTLIDWLSRAATIVIILMTARLLILRRLRKRREQRSALVH